MTRRALHVALVAALALAGCVKVKPAAYQIALDRYYRGLLEGATEEKLSAAIAGVTTDLQKRPSDPNLLLLRTSARLQRLRLGVESKRSFDLDRAREFFDDLRLLQSVLDGPGTRPLWLSARVQTMFGDAVLLKSQSSREAEGAAMVREQIVQAQLFRMAGDAYLRAAMLANQSLTTAKGNKDLETQLPTLGQEVDNARDGYVNALSGLAQSEVFLRLLGDARQHLLDAAAITGGGTFPPAGAVASGPASLFSYAHDLVAKQSAALETLTPNDFPARYQFAQTALREEIAARLLGNPIQPISGNSLPVSNRLALYLAGMTAQAVEPKVTGTGDVSKESLEFALKLDPLYASAKIRGEIPFMTLQVGNEKIPLRFVSSANTVQSFAINPDGILVSIQSRSGTNSLANETAVSYFLGRNAALFAKDKPVVLSGPSNNVLVQVTPQ